MTKSDEILTLRESVRVLQKENEDLKKKLTFATGLPGEIFVLQLTGGMQTGYKEGHDIETENGVRLEVKLSRLNTPSRSKTKRWNWVNILGLNETKRFDYLVLLGEKDPRYEDQYPADLPYVCFLVRRADVDNVKSPGKSSVALNTNLQTARAPQSEALKRHLVHSRDQFKDLAAQMAAP